MPLREDFLREGKNPAYAFFHQRIAGANRDAMAARDTTRLANEKLTGGTLLSEVLA
jgi:hypothetical protein